MTISLLCYGFSLRTIAAIMFLNCSTVSRWVKDFTLRHQNNPAPAEVIIELDEVRGFARFKKKNGGFTGRIAKLLNNFLADSPPKIIPPFLEHCIKKQCDTTQ